MTGKRSFEDALICPRKKTPAISHPFQDVLLGLDFIIFSYLEWGVQWWASLRTVCHAWNQAGLHSRWVALLKPSVDPCKVDLRFVARLHSLRVLDLRKGDWQGGIDDDMLHTLTSLTALCYLELGMCPHVSTDGLQMLAKFPLLRGLGLGDSMLDDFSILDSLTRLQTLSLVCCNRLSTARTLTSSLRHLKLRNCNLANGFAPFLASMTGLETLDIGYNAIGDAGLCQLSALQQLQSLCLDGLPIRCLRSVASLSKLTFLSVKFTQITQDELSSLRLLTNLQVLNAGTCGGIKDATLNILASSLGALRCLNVSGCEITDLGLQHIVKMKGLEILNLFGCNLITAFGLELLVMTTLKELYLSRTVITLQSQTLRSLHFAKIGAIEPPYEIVPVIP